MNANTTLPATLEFSGTKLSVVELGGVPHLAARDLAKALGYADDRAIHRIYRAHASEFSVGMTVVVELTTTSGEKGTRVFSPRGCHLIAMFSRTKPAARFRRWVLDVLEALAPAPISANPAAPGMLRLGSPAHMEADRVARDWFTRAKDAANAGGVMPAFNQKVLEGLVLEQLEHARFLVTFDHQHRIRIEAVPASAVVVPLGEAEDMQRFMDLSVPRHFLPVALMAAANRLATAR